MGACRSPAVGALEHAPVSVRRGGSRRPDGRGYRRQRTHPADAHPRSQRPVEGASAGAGADDPARPRRDGRDLLPHPARRHARGLRRLHAAHQEAAPRSRSQPQLSRQLAAGIRAAGRRTVSDVRARGARRGGVHHGAPQHHRGHDVPYVERRAAAPVRASSGYRDARRGPVVLPGRRCQGNRAHRLSSDLRLSRVPLSPEERDRRHVRLDLRAPRSLQLGGRDLEPDARSGHRQVRLHRLVSRSSAGGRSQAVRMESHDARRRGARRLEGRSITRSSATSRSAGGTVSMPSRIRPCRCSSASSRAFRAGCCGRR